MPAVLTQPFVTEAEYLEMEARSEFKHEYLDGQIVAMAGVKPDHDDIVQNLQYKLIECLRLCGCKFRTSETRVRVKKLDRYGYVYPDLTIVCGLPIYTKDNPPSLTNPTVVFEVLSESTEAHDRKNKLAWYRAQPSIKQIILVDSQSVWVETFTRKDQDWLHNAFDELNHEVSINDCKLLISQIYEQVNFEAYQTVEE